LRWARILRELGHRVTVAQGYDGERYDLLVALHARRSHAAARGFRRRYPEAPIVVALTGTDLYGDLRTSTSARASLEMATHLVVLQPKACDELDARLRRKTRVIYQSVTAPSALSSGRSTPTDGTHAFDVCVIGHLRHVKDPFRAALAARLLPATSRVRIVHVGGAMTEAIGRRAVGEAARNPRYVWLGERPWPQVWRILTSSRVSVISSRMEGGANTLGEAAVAATPILASRIAGNVGLLGENYPGYFPVGDTEALAHLLDLAERDRSFLADLERRCRALVPLFDPARERAAWRDLLREIDSTPQNPRP
jgi:putative glycosyltransferase (TIGR04348 family)